jgi:hypothetical protein
MEFYLHTVIKYIKKYGFEGDQNVGSDQETLLISIIIEFNIGQK